MNTKILDPNTVLMGNKGFLKFDNVELLELKELEIKITPEVKEISLIDSVTKGKIAISYNGTITFEIYKVYSRFKPIALEASKDLQLLNFSLEATVYSQDEKSEETITIDNCWLEGDITLLALKSEGDFLTEKFTAGFEVSSAKFTDHIQDDYTWTYINRNGEETTIDT
jgi:hypothetical protein